MAKLSKIAALRKYFSEGNYGRKIEMSELKDLSPDERDELGEMAKEAIEKNRD